MERRYSFWRGRGKERKKEWGLLLQIKCYDIASLIMCKAYLPGLSIRISSIKEISSEFLNVFLLIHFHWFFESINFKKKKIGISRLLTHQAFTIYNVSRKSETEIWKQLLKGYMKEWRWVLEIIIRESKRLLIPTVGILKWNNLHRHSVTISKDIHTIIII